MLTEETVNEQVIQHLWLLLVSTLFSISASMIAWRKGFFHKPSTIYYPIVSGKEVLKGFIAFLLAQAILVPALIVVFINLMYGKGVTLTMLSTRAQGIINLWLVVGSFL